MFIFSIIQDIFSLFISLVYIAVLAYTYFIFVGLLCIDKKQFSESYILVVFVIFHLFLGIVVIMYLRILSTGDITTKNLFPRARVEADEVVDLTNTNPFFAKEMLEKKTQNFKICSICMTYKPPRSHHCSVCGSCYLRYDHHCYLFGTCIVFQNYKVFYQFLFYNTIFSAFTVAIYIQQLCSSNNTTVFMINYIINIVLLTITASSSIFFFVFHTFLILNNETDVEFQALNANILGDHSHDYIFTEGPITTKSTSKNRSLLNPYNLGKFRNWTEIMGDSWIDWILPTFSTKGDGINFPKNETAAG